MRQMGGSVYNLLALFSIFGFYFFFLPNFSLSNFSLPNAHAQGVAAQYESESSVSGAGYSSLRIAHSTPQQTTIHGQVWHDFNHNGLLDETGAAASPASTNSSAMAGKAAISEVNVQRVSIPEVGIAGVGVRLFRLHESANGNHPDPSQGMVESIAAEFIATATTNISGTFAFTDLLPGDYYVEFSQDELPIGHQITDVDLPEPLAEDATQPAYSNVAVDTRRSPLLTVIGNSNRGSSRNHADGTDGTDGALFAGMGIWFPVSVGNRVWFDDDGNGRQDPGEMGVPDVEITLYSLATNGVLTYAARGATTDANGFYLFGDLVPGVYLVEFDLTRLPAGYRPTRQNAVPDDGLDSDASQALAYSEATPFLGSGVSDNSLDLGLTSTVQIGDRVWADRDQDGFQDQGEIGVANMEVHLMAADGSLVATTTSDGSGHYLFAEILPGEYHIAIDPPTDWVLSPYQKGAYPATDTDSDIDPESGKSAAFVLRAGDQSLDLDIGLSPVSEPNGTVAEEKHWVFVPLTQ